MRLLWLADRLRAWGLTVVEMPGWQERGRPLAGPPRVVVGHHTATSPRAKGDMPTLALLRDGRSDLAGPLAQIGLSRSGVVHVIASGKANHAGLGAWGHTRTSGLTIGIEAEYPGVGPWTQRQLDAFDLTAAALLNGLTLTADAYCGHREWALPSGRKPDPGNVDLRAQRERIRGLLLDGPPDLTPLASPEDPVTDEQLARVLTAVLPPLLAEQTLTITGGRRDRQDDGTVIDPDKEHVSGADVITALERLGDRLVAEIRAPRQ